jgi:hypothetical protein
LILNVAKIASTVLVAGSMPRPVSLLERIEGRPDGLPAEILQYMPSGDAVAAQPPVVTEKIDIDVSGKYRIRVACGFDGQALRGVLDVLERR